ncbi:MAG: DUF4136 domain-containing protein [Crocinitomicaceae bacterium]|nr:DUF4136 domain-containing protein [Crocinitomicaceae bacterium]
MNVFKTLILTFLGAVVLGSCYKYPDVSIQNEALDMTITIGDDSRDYTQYTYFTFEDTIRLVRIVNGDQVESDSIINPSDASYIMNELRKKMEAYGYTYTTDTALADVVFIAHAMDITSEGSGVDCYNPGYWWGYYPTYPSYGWGYPGWGYPGYGYPWYGGCYSYEYFSRRGTLIWDLFDKKNFNGTQIESIWVGSIIGVLNESGNYNKFTRIDRGINEAFIQSPYLDISSN